MNNPDSIAARLDRGEDAKDIIAEAILPPEYIDLSHFTIPVLDGSIGKFGGIALMDDNEKPGPIVAKLPPGRRVAREHVDHIVSVWKNRRDLAPLNVYDTAHEIEVVEGTLHQQRTEIITHVEAAGSATVEWSRPVKQTEQATQPITSGDQMIINNIIAERTGIEQAIHILPELHLQYHLAADSLDVIDILLGIEKHLDIEIPDNTYSQIETVQDIYNIVAAMQDQGPDTEDGQWAFGWALRFGKGKACYSCGGHGHDGEYIECKECHGSGVVGYKRKPVEQ